MLRAYSGRAASTSVADWRLRNAAIRPTAMSAARMAIMVHPAERNIGAGCAISDAERTAHVETALAMMTARTSPIRNGTSRIAEAMIVCTNIHGIGV